MPVAIATTNISILRGTTTDAFADDQDTDTVIARRIPAALTEQNRRVTTRDDPTPRIIRYAVARVASGTDVTDQDRILDERTGAIYIIDAVSAFASPAITPDLRLDLRRTT